MKKKQEHRKKKKEPEIEYFKSAPDDLSCYSEHCQGDKKIHKGKPYWRCGPKMWCEPCAKGASRLLPWRDWFERTSTV